MGETGKEADGAGRRCGVDQVIMDVCLFGVHVLRCLSFRGMRRCGGRGMEQTLDLGLGVPNRRESHAKVVERSKFHVQ